MTLRIVSVQRNIGVSIAWVAVLYTLPLFGFIAYILLGEPMIGRRYRERVDQASLLMNDMARREHLVFDQGQNLLPVNYRGVSQIGTRWTGLGVFPDHKMQLLTESNAIFQSLIEDINAAQRIILMEFYIVYPKGQVLEVIEALSAAAERGVECHVLADSVGSFSFFNSSAHRTLERAGVFVHQSLPVGLFKTLFKRSDLRNHRKMVIMDEHIGYIGSFNLVDPNDNLHALNQRVNSYTRRLYVMDPTINDLNSRVKVLGDHADYHKQPDIGSTSIIIPRMPVVEGVLAQLIPSAPQVTAHVIYNTLVTVVHRANKRIRITTPYFVPDEALSGALAIAAKRGVEVTLIVPEKVDSFLVQHASQACYQELLEAGVTIALFKGGLLHAKTVVIDDDYCLFGTVNIDQRSFYLNMEVSLAIYTPAMVAQVADCQEVYLQNCRYLGLEEWCQRHGAERLFDNVVRLFSPLL
jgi:cardiolipin synthase A/B